MRAAGIGVWLLVLGMSPALAENAAQFDLNCSGQAVARAATESPDYPYDKSPHPYATRLRVDLGAGLFCQDACTDTEAIAVVSPAAVLFRNQSLPRANRFVVSRTNGAFSVEWNEPGDAATHRPFLWKTATGQCTKEQFTPMPQKVF